MILNVLQFIRTHCLRRKLPVPVRLYGNLNLSFSSLNARESIRNRAAGGCEGTPAKPKDVMKGKLTESQKVREFSFRTASVTNT